MTDSNLVTTCTFHGQEYLFKMNVLYNNLEILVTDKNTGEEWQCNYDATYIENLTQKTGNFKQFDIFIAMIKSGLLRTSESVSLDLFTFEDLEMLRSRKITKSVGNTNLNRRYLIVTYAVEFDKIRYPLPLEYCGPPDPFILQNTIKRLEMELIRTKEELTLKHNSSEARKISFLQKRVDELTEENLSLQDEVRHLTRLLERKPKASVTSLQKAVQNLEKSVVSERNSHRELVEKLRNEKVQLAKELEKLRCSERNLKYELSKIQVDSRAGIGDHTRLGLVKKHSNDSLETMFRRSESRRSQARRPQSRRSRRSESPDRDAKLKPKPSNFINETRSSKSLCHVRSRSSSTSSNARHVTTDKFRSCRSNVRTPSPSPQRSISKGFCSGASSRASSRPATKRRSRKDVDYQKLEEKIEKLQKVLKQKLLCDA